LRVKRRAGYDFRASKSRIDGPGVQPFEGLLRISKTQKALRRRGFQLESTS